MPVNNTDVDAAIVNDEIPGHCRALRCEARVFHRDRVLIDQQNLLGWTGDIGDFYAFRDGFGQ